MKAENETATSGFRFGLIGAGAFGPVLARQIQQVAAISAVYEPDQAKLKNFVGQFGRHIHTCTSLEELLARKDVDAVAITSPNFTHKSITIAAAGAGKHVFCEKAMANSVPDCWDMVAACEEAGVRLMIGHKRSLRPPWRRMIDLLEDLGPVLSLSVCLYYKRAKDKPAWWMKKENSGGTLFVSGIHEIDWMRAMCGDVKRIRAIAPESRHSSLEFPETMHTQLEFASGAIGSLDVSLAFEPLQFRESGGAMVVGKYGSIRLIPNLTHIDIYWGREGDESIHSEQFEDLGHDYAFRKEIRDFVRWVRYGTEPCLTWREGLKCVEVLEACNRSVDSNGASIELPLYPEYETT